MTGIPLSEVERSLTPCKHDHCGRCCVHGCAGTAELTDAERVLLDLFAQYAFLPLAFDPATEGPVCLEHTVRTQEEASAALISLWNKRLIRIVYDMPLSNFDYSAFRQYERYGSAALTAFGQAALDGQDTPI